MNACQVTKSERPRSDQTSGVGLPCQSNPGSDTVPKAESIFRFTCQTREVVDSSRAQDGETDSGIWAQSKGRVETSKERAKLEKAS